MQPEPSTSANAAPPAVPIPQALRLRTSKLSFLSRSKTNTDNELYEMQFSMFFTEDLGSNWVKGPKKY
ncbi:hypothetical protein WN48_11211 [Eufriesea mexicana]|uniref:Uncharacterized protein n=1 Tax=Eufriesea mexicana TaxID=516756 RepID=A0A310S5V1_9HYME|nr:hypothetical protein WN48_11211 [Eufriesea mexicana]